MDPSSGTLSNELNFDVLQHICRTCYAHGPRGSLIALSTTSKSFRAAAAPLIFRAIRMREDWNADSFRDLLSLRGIHHHIRAFTFFPGSIEMLLWAQAGSNAVSEELSQCAPLFVELLTSLPHLESLCLVPQLQNIHQHKAVLDILRSSVPTLSELRNLRVPDDALFLWSCAPLVDSIFLDPVAWTHDWPDAPLIKRLGIGYIPSDLVKGRSYLQAIQERMPNVQSLTIDSGPFSVEGLLGNMPGPLRLRLVTLALPALAQLEVGYFPPMCGFAWSRMTEEERKGLSESQWVAQNRVKAAVVAAFPRLKYLWIGSQEVFDLTHLGAAEPGCIANALDRLEPIYVPYGQSALAYIDDPACMKFSM